MSDEKLKPKRRWPWVIALTIAACAVAVVVLWLIGPKFWTDDRTIHVASNHASTRTVLWDPPRALGPQFASDQQEYEPCLSPDGTEFYFVRNKAGQNADIYISYRRNNQWTAPVSLDAINSPYDDLGPRLTPDGRFLLFYSDRPGGFGGYDIWASARVRDGWGKPFNLGPEVNSEYNEFSPDPTPDGKHLIFTTNRKAAQGEQKQAWRATIRQTENGDYDLWIAEVDDLRSLFGMENLADASVSSDQRDSTRPVNVISEVTTPAGSGSETRPSTDAPTTAPAAPLLAFKPASEIPNVNTPFMEGASCMSPAGDFLYFASNRPGGFGKFDIYRSRVYPMEAGQWRFGKPENVGPQINTADNETDPSLALNGFRLYLSSDRGNDTGVYHLLASDSREVYPLYQNRPVPHLGLSFWLMLLSLLVLLPLLLFLRGMDERRLGILQKCLLLSLLVHAAICFALSFLNVTSKAYHYVRQEMGIELPIALDAPKEMEVGDAIRRQSTSDLPVEGAPPEPMLQTQTRVETVTTAGPVDVVAPAARVQLNAEAMTIGVPKPVLPAARSDAVAVNPNAQRDELTDLHLAPSAAVSGLEAQPQAVSAETQLAQSVVPAAIQQTPKFAPPAIGPSEPNSNNGTIVAAVPLRRAIPSATEAGEMIPEAGTGAQVDVPPVSASSRSHVAVSKPETSIITETPVAATPQAQPAPNGKPSEIRSAVPRSERVPSSAINGAAMKSTRTPAIAAVSAPPAASPAPGAQMDVQSGLNDPANALPARNKIIEPARDAVAADAALPTTQPITKAADNPQRPDIMKLDGLQPTGVRAANNDFADSHISAAPLTVRAQDRVSSVSAQPVASSINPSLRDEPDPALPKPLISAESNRIARTGTSTERPTDPDALAFASRRTEHGVEGGGAKDILIDIQIDPAEPLNKPSGNSKSLDPLRSRPRPAAVATEAVVPDLSPILPPPSDIGPVAAVLPPSPFKLRAPEEHQPVIEQLGGTKESEGAVERGLAYLASVQEDDGRWTYITGTRRPRQSSGRHAHDPACTALSVLAFLAQDHRPDKPGKYQEVVSKALDFLVSEQLEDGDLRGPMRGGGADQGNMYDHGIATLALAEAALMTRDPRYTDAAIKAANFIIAAQNQETGGWRYIPNEAGDSSVFGWQIMALHSAEQLGFQIPPETRRGAIRYIAMASTGGHHMVAGYQPFTGASAPMTAEIVFCRMLLGQQLTEDEADVVGAYLGRQPPEAGNPDIYYWYYGSLCMMQMQNDAWKEWNTRTRDMLVHSQRKLGDDKGYWDNMRWSDRGGRVFTTAMATLTLEVYYRYMPMQKRE